MDKSIESTVPLSMFIIPVAFLLISSSRSLLIPIPPLFSQSQSQALLRFYFSLILENLRVNVRHIPIYYPGRTQELTSQEFSSPVYSFLTLQCFTCNFSVFCFSYRLSGHCVKFQRFPILPDLMV